MAAEQEAIRAVQQWLSRVPGHRPQELTATPYEDGWVVAPTPPTYGAGLFLVRRGTVRSVASVEVPEVPRIWAGLVAEQG